jgi:hypothetical protein
MKSEIIRVRTGARDTVADITGECADFARAASGGGDGLLHVFVPHATAGIAVLEVGSGSDDDLLSALESLLPADDRWRHAHGTRRSRCSADASHSGRGSRSRSSTSTWTIQTGRSACPSSPADPIVRSRPRPHIGG